MVEHIATDMVMRFVHGRRPARLKDKEIDAECALAVDPNDKMMDGFRAISSYHDWSNFFEITEFGFEAELSEGEDEASSKGPPPPPLPSSFQSRPNAHGLALPKPAGAGANGKSGPEMSFKKWRSAVGDEYRKILYPTEFRNFSFKRLIDGTSPVFFEACCYAWIFSKAVMVKRVSRGYVDEKSPVSGIGFLRLEFSDVLITDLKWNDGEVVTEECECICRGFKAEYKPQRSSGALAETAETAEWIQAVHGNALKQRGAS